MLRNLIKPLGIAILIGTVATGSLPGAHLIPELSMASKAGEFSRDNVRTSATARSSVSVSTSSSATSRDGKCSARASATAVARGEDGYETSYDEKHARSDNGSCSAAAKARASTGNRPPPGDADDTVGVGAKEE